MDFGCKQERKAVKSSCFLFLIVCVTVWHPTLTEAEMNWNPADPGSFISTPSNTTVPVGERVVFKCTVSVPTQLCRWYFLETGLNFFDKRVTPMLVKDFRPSHYRDCSIKIDKARKVQEGQWLCQALSVNSNKFIMTEPANLRVITDAESSTWEPPITDPSPTIRHGRRQDGGNIDKSLIDSGDDEWNNPDSHVLFESSGEDYIQNTAVGESAVLKCQINKPVASCSWMMPNGEIFNISKDIEAPNANEDYRLEGDLDEGNCSLRVREVGVEDEGNWRCVVNTEDIIDEKYGPLIHLHINDHHHGPATYEGTPLATESNSLNSIIIALVTTSAILFIIVIFLCLCLYRRFKADPEEKHRILQVSPRNSVDISRKGLPITELTDNAVVAVEPKKKLLNMFHNLDTDHYNQYLDMTGSGATSDGYIMMPGSSIRSSTSSRTTLSTLSTLPAGRSRSASNSTSISGGSPNLSAHVDNPTYNPEIVLQQKGLSSGRPTSLYCTDHVYEEIKEREPEKMAKIAEAITPETPTYTNLIEDFHGYMIPKKTSSNTLAYTQPQNIPITQSNFPSNDQSQDRNIPNPPLPNATVPGSQAPPYSCLSQNGLVPVNLTQHVLSNVGPGYSRVGVAPSQDPMENYDTPRSTPVDPMDGYDVPRSVPVEQEAPPQTDIPKPTEVSVNGLTGTIV